MYQVLYRKYRPKVFRDVVGQEHITQTLSNELSSGRLSHAYLFTGTRGTGKTTCAKILAKAMNCLSPQNGDPCNECQVCRGIDNGSIFDVVEIDAASNNGVDNIRDLREEANFTPSVGKFRVYIIDEVHMLSTGAFNALLKTLEEPPEHVKFILATTEIHKLPATILSRCQRFDFKRIRSEAMAQRLHYVAKEEGFTVTDDGALLIARIADGALRDALSILDQCAGRASTVDATLVSQVCGIADKTYLYTLGGHIATHNTPGAMELLNELHQNSCDMERLCTELLNHFRNLLVVKTVKKSRELIICSEEEYQLITQETEAFTLEQILFALDLFQTALEHMKQGANRRTEVEMTFIRLCEPALDQGTASILARLSALERGQTRPAASIQTTKQPASEAPSAPQPVIKSQAPAAAPDAPEPAPVTEPEPYDDPEPPAPQAEIPLPPAASSASPEPSAEENVPFRQWGAVMDRIFEIDKPLFGILSGSAAMQRGDFILIDSPNPTIREFIQKPEHSKAIKQAVFETSGMRCRLGLFRRAAAETASTPEDPLEALARLAKDSGVDVTIQ